MPATTSPTVRRRTLGALLRQHRLNAGLKTSDVADRLICHPSKITRIESGERAASPRDLRDLCDIYGITDEGERDRLTMLARESKQRGWWQQYDLETPAYIGLEVAAHKLSNFESSIVPGLLQTADYASAVLRATRPELSDDQVAQTVDARLARQASAAETGRPELLAIVDEGALHRVCGSTAIMRAQLARLVAEASGNSNLTLRVVPFQAGAHQGLSSTFALLEFAEAELTPVVFVEGLVGYLYLEQAADIARYRGALERIQGSSLAPNETIDLINKVRRKYR